MFYIVASHAINDEGGIADIYFTITTNERKADVMYAEVIDGKRQYPDQTVELYVLTTLEGVYFNLDEEFRITLPNTDYYTSLEPIKKFTTPGEDDFDYAKQATIEADFTPEELAELVTIQVDIACDYEAHDFGNQAKQVARLKREYWVTYRVELTLVELNGPGGGAAVVEMSGTRPNLLRWIEDCYSDGSGGSPEERLEDLLGE